MKKIERKYSSDIFVSTRNIIIKFLISDDTCIYNLFFERYNLKILGNYEKHQTITTICNLYSEDVQ